MNPHLKILAALKTHGTCALVTVTAAEGSTPREVGAWMVITPDGFHGTIGGGTLEWHAMAEAQSLLGKPAMAKTIRKHLGPDLGQCCGGRVDIKIESFDASSIGLVQTSADLFVEELRHLHLWGAGHVGRALVMALAPLPFKISWWDARPNAFPSHVPQNVTCRVGVPADMEPDAFVLVMSHSHALDFEVIDFALRNPAFEFVGLIGSQTKRARFVKRLTEAGADPTRLTCPIGVSGVKSKLPAVIAAGVVVQLIGEDERVKFQTSAAITSPFPQWGKDDEFVALVKLKLFCKS
jgi:xanthine dehydrogenase accessory factor